MTKLDKYKKWTVCKIDGREEPLINCFIAPPKLILESTYPNHIGRVQVNDFNNLRALYINST
jgi:hypothetical protein